MIFFSPRQLFLSVCLVVLALSAGCDQSSSTGNSKLDDNSPEERFNRIMESFRRKIDGQPVGFVVTQGSSRTTMLGSNKVSSELIKPTTPDGHYKAVVTVATESHYSLRRTTTAEDAEREKNSKNKNSTDSSNDKNGVGILEPDLAGPSKVEAAQSPTKPPTQDQEIVTRRPDEDVRKYELVDDGQHWTLVTKLNNKTEQSIQFAFDEAIKQQ